MKPRILALTAALALLWGATAALGASNQDAGRASSDGGTANTPAAVLTEQNYEFKPVVDGQEVTHDFHIKNTGDGPLDIQRVKTG